MPLASSFKRTRPLHAGQTTLNVSMKSGVIANSFLAPLRREKASGSGRLYRLPEPEAYQRRGARGNARRSLPETLAVLVRREERLDHLRALKVAAEVFQLLEPEVVAVEVRVGRVVGRAPQVAEVLHQHERGVRLALVERAVLQDEPQGARARREVFGVRRAPELGGRRLGLGRGERVAGVRVERGDELRGRERERVVLLELGALDELVDVGRLARLKLQLPTGLAHDDARAYLARVERELQQALGRAPVRGLVSLVGEEARLLELNREEERGRDVYARGLHAGRVRAAMTKLILPEGEPRGVRVAAEEVSVVLAHEELGVVQGVGGRRVGVVVADGDDERGAVARDRVALGHEPDGEVLVAFDERVVRDEYREGLLGLARRERDAPRRADHVGAARGRAALNLVDGRDLLRSVAAAPHGHFKRAAALAHAERRRAELDEPDARRVEVGRAVAVNRLEAPRRGRERVAALRGRDEVSPARGHVERVRAVRARQHAPAVGAEQRVRAREVYRDAGDADSLLGHAAADAVAREPAREARVGVRGEPREGLRRGREGEVGERGGHSVRS